MRKNIFGLHFLVAVVAFAGVACKKDVTGPINQWTDSSTTSLVRLMPFGKLSQWRDNMAVVATGSKLIFAGGSNYVPQGDGSYIEVAYATVDIYDKITQTWTTASLSKARIAMAAIAHEDKVYFAGGFLGEDQGYLPSSRIDIYDATSNSWTIAELNKPRGSIVAAATGNKLVFAGGSKTPDVFGPESSDEVDIYDAASGAWSVAHLPQPRAHHTASVVGNKIYIAGGVNQFISKSIDILDVTTNAWSTSLLSEPKSAHAAAVIDDKIYWIGGRTNAGPSTTIEIFNTSTQITSFSQLPEVVETYLPALYRNGQLILFINIYGDPKAIILDINSGTWKEKHFVMPHYPSSFACLDNNIYMANGFNVWRVEL